MAGLRTLPGSVWRWLCLVVRLFRTPGQLLERFRRGLRDGGLVLVGLTVGATLDRFLTPHPTWPWHIVVVLLAVAVIAVVLLVSASIGERNTEKDVSNREVLSAIRNLEGRLVSSSFSSRGPEYVGASIGATGAAGPPTAQTRTTFSAIAAGEVGRHPINAGDTVTIIGDDGEVDVTR